MQINNIKTKQGQELKLGKLAVLVGPNNVGKSQTLRDIHDKFTKGVKTKSVIIDDIEMLKPDSFEDAIEGLSIREHPENIGQHEIQGIGASLTGNEVLNVNLDHLKMQFDENASFSWAFGILGKFRVSYLNAQSRLNVAQATASYNPHFSQPQNLLQGLFADDTESASELSQVFAECFGMDIKLDYSGLTHLMLRVTKRFDDIPGDPKKAFPIMSKYSRLDDQGDGFKSFVGVVLSLLLSKNRLILLDEPEAFLHPEQARQLGYWIAEHSLQRKGQIIIATHNSNFLSGILSSAQPVNIFRLNRENDNTSYTQVSVKATEQLAKSPVLSSQRVLDAMFYAGVVVCEADADRAVYRAVADRYLNIQDILFIHAHNKQTIPKIVQLLRETSTPVCSITDFDILRDKQEFSTYIRGIAPNASIDQFESDRSSLVEAINEINDSRIVADIRGEIEELLQQIDDNKHGLSGIKGALNRIRKESSKWKAVKSQGINSLSEEASKSATNIINSLKEFGCFITPVGELESWMDVGTKQKNKWIVSALEALYNGTCPAELTSFVEEVVSKVRKLGS